MTDQVIDLQLARQNRRPLLERLQQALAPADPVAEINAILERPDYLGYIQSMNPHRLFALIRDAGWDEGHELVPYVRPQQLQVMLDLDIWQKDSFVPARLEPWLAVLVAEAEDEDLKRTVRELDPELLALFFKHHVRADLIEDGEIPLHLGEGAVLSPDNAYGVAYPEDEDTAALLRGFLDRLYQVDMAMAWTLLEATRWELLSQMEHTASRLRQSRLDEAGFVGFDEAIAIYATLNPAAFRQKLESGAMEQKIPVRPGAQVDLPAVLASRMTEDFFFSQVLAQVPDPRRLEELLFELVGLINRAATADGVEPGDLEFAEEVTRRTVGYLSLGLEFLSRTEQERALALIQEVPLRKIFSTGFSLAQKLQKTVFDLTRRPTLTLVEGERFSLLGPEDEALCDALTRPRPTYAADSFTYDVLREQSQVDDAAQRLGMIAFKQLWFFGVRGIRLDALANLVYGGQLANEPVDVTFDSLFATDLARVLLGIGPELRGLNPVELDGLPAKLEARPWADDLTGYFEPLLGPILTELPPASARMATRWIAQTIDMLTENQDLLDLAQAPQFVLVQAQG